MSIYPSCNKTKIYKSSYIFMLIDVCEGQYLNKKVAIKQLKDNDKAAQAFLAEASVMT